MQSTDSLGDLILLSQSRWLAPLIAALARSDGGRFAALSRSLGLASDTLTRTLKAAMAAGLVMRNPGYGHPLRPEYILTAEGQRLAMLADAQMMAQTEIGIAPSSLTRWGMPIIHLIGSGMNRFNTLSRALSPATPRALSQGLRRLGEERLIARTLVDAWPPVTCYGLTGTGTRLAGIIALPPCSGGTSLTSCGG